MPVTIPMRAHMNCTQPMNGQVINAVQSIPVPICAPAIEYVAIPRWIVVGGAGTIPKGEAAPGEDLLTRAQIEFEEELGFRPECFLGWIELGSVKQKGGKTVHAWAFEGDLPESFELKSNLFEIEWPPRSGKRKKIPEIDQALFFSEEVAKRKINPAQVAFLDRLRVAIKS